MCFTFGTGYLIDLFTLKKQSPISAECFILGLLLSALWELGSIISFLIIVPVGRVNQLVMKRDLAHSSGMTKNKSDWRSEKMELELSGYILMYYLKNIPMVSLLTPHIFLCLYLSLTCKNSIPHSNMHIHSNAHTQISVWLSEVLSLHCRLLNIDVLLL